jgi:iron complex outermembrane receptor protein
VDVDMRRHTVRAEGDLHHHVGPFADVRAVAAVTDYEHTEREASGAVGTRFGQVLAQGEVVARHERLGALAQGAVGTRVQFRDVVTGGSLRTPSTQDVSVAGFVVEEIGTGPLRLQGGFRYDWARFTPQEREFVVVRDERIPTLPRTFGSFSGSLGLLWAPSEALRVGGSVARAYRTPDINELYSDGPHLAAYSYDVGNPRIGDETGVGTDVFVRWTRPRVRAEVAGFANLLGGFIYPRNTGELGRQGGRPKFQYTGVDARLAGGEAELEWTVLPRVVVDGTLSYVRGTLRGTPDSLPALDGAPARLGSRALPFIPPLNGRLGARYDRPRFFVGAGARGAARQERLGDFEEPTAGWVVGDVNAGVRLLVGSRLHTFTLRVDNLLDQEYREHLSRTKAIMPEAGRNVTLLYRVGF